MASQGILTRIEAKIAAGDFYDAQQMVKTMHRRLVIQGKHGASADLCVKSAQRLCGAGQYELAADLGKELVASLEAQRAPPDQRNVKLIEALLSGIPPHEAVVPKYAVIHRALSWSSATVSSGHPEVHRIAAMCYWSEQEYGKCQGHYVYCGDGPGLARMVREWRATGYPCEGDLFALRALLILLSLDDLMTARTYWAAMVGEDIASCGAVSDLPETGTDPSAPPPPAVQCGTFLLAAAEAKSLEFFRAVRAKFTLVMRRDASFDKYLDEVEVRVFGAQQQRGGLGALLEAFMGGGGGGGR